LALLTHPPNLASLSCDPPARLLQSRNNNLFNDSQFIETKIVFEKHIEAAMTNRIHRSHNKLLFFLIPLVLYIFLAVQFIWLPGIYYDEVLGAVPAIAALEGDVPGPYVQVEGSVIHLGKVAFPLMILPYLGSMQTAVLIPVFALFGISVPVMRGAYIFLGALGLLGSYLFTARYFNRSTAWVATLLLAVDPTYIFATRSDNGPTTVMMICKMGALWLFLMWWQSRKRIFLLLGAFIAGIGVYDKLNFVWFLGALGVAMFTIFPVVTWQRLIREKWYILISAGASFFVGSSIFWAYTFASGGGVFREIGKILIRQTAFGVENSAVFSNLLLRFESFVNLLFGREILSFYMSIFDYQSSSSSLSPGTLIPWLVLLVLLLTIIQIVTGLAFGLHTKKILFLVVLTVVIIAASIFTPTNFMYHHLLVAYPFPHLLIAYFLIKTPHILSKIRLKPQFTRNAGYLILFIAVGINLYVVQNTYQILNKTGGKGMWSSAIYTLADYLKDDERVVVVMDWGINLNLLMLTSGKLSTQEPWQEFVYTSDYSEKMEALVNQPEAIFVFHSSEYTGIYSLNDFDGPRITFFKTIEAMGAKPILERQIFQPDGHVLFELYRVSPREEVSLK
jgi:hypothetical protein